MGKLDQRVAIVTGGGTGIGRNISLEFAKAGAAVVVGSRTLANLERVADEIRAMGGRSLAVRTDVRIPEQINNLVRQTIDKFGRIDILVNNAGIEYRTTLLTMSEEVWDDVINTNLKGVFFCTQAVARYMIEQKYGKIINISSIAGMRGMAPPNYCASKAGVIQLTRSTAWELGHYGINVNSIAPGTIDTEFNRRYRTPEQVEQVLEYNRERAIFKKLGDTQDIASAALFLASDDSSFMCGETIVVDGGRAFLDGHP